MWLAAVGSIGASQICVVRVPQGPYDVYETWLQEIVYTFLFAFAFCLVFGMLTNKTLCMDGEKMHTYMPSEALANPLVLG